MKVLGWILGLCCGFLAFGSFVGEGTVLETLLLTLAAFFSLPAINKRINLAVAQRKKDKWGKPTPLISQKAGVVASVALVFFALAYSTGSKIDSAKPVEISQQVEASAPQPLSVNDNETQASIDYIAGIQPSDVYLNLENKGFSKKGPRRIGTDTPEIWLWEIEGQSHSSLPDKVEVWSRNGVSKVYKVMVKSYSPNRDLARFIATIPYDGAKPGEASKWVESNYTNDGATTSIGGVPFKIMRQGSVTLLKIGYSAN